MKTGTPINYYCPGQVIDKNGILKDTVSQRMELAEDYDGTEYCMVRPLLSRVEGTLTRWQYVTMVFN